MFGFSVFLITMLYLIITQVRSIIVINDNDDASEEEVGDYFDDFETL